jgi:hypothetical protein
LSGPHTIKSLDDSLAGLSVEGDALLPEGVTAEIDSLSGLCNCVFDVLYGSVVRKPSVTYERMLTELGEHIYFAFAQYYLTADASLDMEN